MHTYPSTCEGVPRAVSTLTATRIRIDRSVVAKPARRSRIPAKSYQALPSNFVLHIQCPADHGESPRAPIGELYRGSQSANANSRARQNSRADYFFFPKVISKFKVFSPGYEKRVLPRRCRRSAGDLATLVGHVVRESS